MTDTEEPRGPGYEEQDVSLRALWRPALGMVFLAVFALVAMVWLIAGLEDWRRPAPADPDRVAVREGEVIPPGPRLQRRPEKELESIQAEAERVLGSYGWVNEAEGTVRIPIERAMDLVAARGLPHRPSRNRDGEDS